MLRNSLKRCFVRSFAKGPNSSTPSELQKRRALEFSQKLMHEDAIGFRYDKLDHHFEEYELSKGVVNGNELNFILGDQQGFKHCQELVADFQRIIPKMNVDTDNHLNDYLRNYFEKTPNFKNSYEDIFCKREIQNWFIAELSENRQLYKIRMEPIICMRREIEKKDYARLDFTLSYLVSNTYQSQLALGDIALNFTTKEIEEAFAEALKATHQKLDDPVAKPVTGDLPVFYHFKSTAKGLLGTTLLRKASHYTASVISTAAKLNKKTIVLGTTDAFPYVVSLLRHPEQLLSPKEYFREYLVSEEEIDRQTKELVTLLRKQYLGMGMERTFVEEIQDYVVFQKKQNLDRQIGKKRLDAILSTGDPEEILYKYSLLSYLVNNDATAHSELGVEYFKHTVFAPLFESMQLEEVVGKYLDYEQQARSSFIQLVNQQIDRVPKYLSEPICRERTRDFRTQIGKTRELMDSMAQPKIVVDKRAEAFLLDKSIELIGVRLIANIKKRMDAGESQQDALLALKALQSGTANEEQQSLMEDLVIEANSQVDAIRLPKRYLEKEKIITHQYKKRVADKLMLQAATALNEGLGYEGRSDFDAVLGESSEKPRDYIKVTPEIMGKLIQASKLSMQEQAANPEIFDMIRQRDLALNLENQSLELVKNASDAKLHKIAFNPSGEAVPINLTEMSPEELEANGITHFKAADITMDSAGNINRAILDTKNTEKMLSALEKLYDMKKDPNKSKTNKLSSVYEDRDDSVLASK